MQAQGSSSLPLSPMKDQRSPAAKKASCRRILYEQDENENLSNSSSVPERPPPPQSPKCSMVAPSSAPLSAPKPALVKLALSAVRLDVNKRLQPDATTANDQSRFIVKRVRLEDRTRPPSSGAVLTYLFV